jgi:hypothetical protein
MSMVHVVSLQGEVSRNRGVSRVNLESGEGYQSSCEEENRNALGSRMTRLTFHLKQYSTVYDGHCAGILLTWVPGYQVYESSVPCILSAWLL